VRLHVTAASGFGIQASAALRRMRDSTSPGDHHLEIVLAPGEYRDEPINLVDPMPGSRLEVVLRGEDPGRPPVLTNVAVQLQADAVEVAGVVFKDNWTSVPLLDCRIGTRLLLRQCAFLGNLMTGDRPGTGLIEVFVGYGGGPKRAEFEATWFIGNAEVAPSALVLFDGRPPDSIEHLRLENVAFVDNHVTVGVAPATCHHLQFARCFFGSPTASDSASLPAVLCAPRYTRTAIAFEDGAALVDGLHNLVGWAASPPLPVAEYQPVQFDNSLLAVRSPPGAGPTPEGLNLESARLLRRPAPDQTRLDTIRETCGVEALGGATPTVQRLLSLYSVEP
jgi:hypothetical protein